MRNFTITTIVALAAVQASLAVAAQGASAPVTLPTDPVLRSAVLSPRAHKAVMLSVVNVDQRLIAAGERGIVLVSSDGGQTWQQGQVPVAVTLTAMSFVDANTGWAVGHGGVILATRDGGLTWVRQLDGRHLAQRELDAARASGDARRIALAEHLVTDGADKPLLAVHFWNAKRGFAVGAYGIAVGTEDGGVTWQPWTDRIDNPRGLHLNALHVAGSRIFLAGEQGLLLRSQDDGKSFQPLVSPYKGSWLAMTGHDDVVVVAGLRGNVFWSNDGGAQWTASNVPSPQSITFATRLKSGALLFANQAGQILQSNDEGRSLQALRHEPGPPVTAVTQGREGTLIAATFAGPMRMSAQTANLPSTPRP